MNVWFLTIILNMVVEFSFWDVESQRSILRVRNLQVVPIRFHESVGHVDLACNAMRHMLCIPLNESHGALPLTNRDDIVLRGVVEYHDHYAGLNYRNDGVCHSLEMVKMVEDLCWVISEHGRVQFYDVLLMGRLFEDPMGYFGPNPWHNIYLLS